MVLLIDNYDSFTWNIYQQLSALGARVEVFRNDRLTVARAMAMRPERLVISPGPGRPENAGCSVEMIKAFLGRVPVLGVCLGHQAAAVALGGRVVPAGRLMHGKTSMVYHDGAGIFRGLPDPFEATRYHSLIVEKSTLPDDFVVAAWTRSEEIMGLRHREHHLYGVQFHPESILTREGTGIMRNFLSLEQ